MTRLFLMFTLVPALELYLLVQLGVAFGAGPTLLLVLGTGFVGAWLARREGVGVLLALRDDLARGLPPATRLVEGALVLAGGLLLLTPGVLTDLAGLLLLFPPTRRAVAPRLLDALAAWGARHGASVQLGRVDAGGGPVFTQAPRATAARPPSTPFDHPVA